ncbi:hypothetical protein L3Q82_025375, partial [Scortum barcoo]
MVGMVGMVRYIRIIVPGVGQTYLE